MSGSPGGGERGGGGGRDRGRRPGAIYSILVGLIFIAILAVAGLNALQSDESRVLGAGEEEGVPLAQFAVPDARSELEGDSNIAQDDCESSEVPCPEDARRAPACRVEVEGAIRVCDLFGRPLVISFWFTRGGDCEAQQDVFEAVYRRRSDDANFLSVNVGDGRDEVRRLIDERGWTHPVGLDPDGALGDLYRVGGCPTFLYAYPGGILQATSVGELEEAELEERIDRLVAASEKRRGELR